MQNTTSEISEKRLDVLHHLKTYEGEILNLRRLANLRIEGEAEKKDVEATRRLVKRMHDDGLVNYESSYSGSKVSLTSDGREIIENSPYPQGNVGADVGGESLERFHGFVVEGRIMSDTPDDWIGVMQEKSEVSVLDDRESQSIIAKDIWVIRLHKDTFTLQLREGCSISSNHSAEVFRKAHTQARNVGAWLEGAAGIRVQLKRFKITNAELGFEGHPLAELAGDLPGVPLDRFSVMDPDLQKEALGIDGSPAEHEELEPKSERTESIAQTIEEEMQQYVKRPEAVERRHGFENELLAQDISGHDAVHAVRQVEEMKKEQERQGDALSRVVEALEKIQDNREAEKDTRDALMELVRSNKQERERMEERMQTQIENQQEIIERQEEQIEKQSEIIEGLQEEVEDLRGSEKSLEARVRERFDENPNFSEVHEHSSDDNHSLYVWDLSDGWENRKYRKVLDEELRDKIKVEAHSGRGGVQAYG